MLTIAALFLCVFFRLCVCIGFVVSLLSYFFFQAEDGIRDHCVTGVQTCALPILYLFNLNTAFLALSKEIIGEDGKKRERVLVTSVIDRKSVV